MVNRSFFARWEASHKLTQDTLLAFPEDTLGREVITGLLPPGEMFCHIYAHVNSILRACLSRSLSMEDLKQLPHDVDCHDRDALLRYSRVTMNTLFAHAGQSARAWEQTIHTPDGDMPMESLCKGAYEHELLHRGQMIAMLKHLGIDLPVSVTQIG